MKGPLSIWLKDSEGLSETNIELLHQVQIILSVLKGPWLIAADWNMEPQVLQSSRWLEVIGGVIRAPDKVTCNDSIFDYFVVHKEIAPSVVSVTTLDNAGYKAACTCQVTTQRQRAASHGPTRDQASTCACCAPAWSLACVQ